MSAPHPLTAAAALGLRMRALLLAPGATPAPSSVEGVVTHVGAMQAQDYGSGLWSLASRLPGATQDDVTAALERREALRTWPMRGTVHLVPSRDAHWMLELTGVRALAGAARRREFLGLAQADADRAVEVLGEALAGGGRLTRAQCLAALQAAGLQLDGNLGYHLLWYASQRGVTAIAPHVDGEQTFVLLDEWVPDPVVLDRDEALATLAARYFRSHGPTTVKDFAGWTGLTMSDAKRAVALAGEALAGAELDGAVVHLDPALLEAELAGTLPDPDRDVIALPGFDEYLLGYKDRTLMLAPGDLQAVVPGNNGMFRATLVRGGRVIATWTRTLTARRVTVTPIPLTPLRARDRSAVEAALAPYAHFLGRELAVRWD